jgi:carbamoyltransferase
MIAWGISANSHDAALAVFDIELSSMELVFASQAERYSGIKNDAHLNEALIQDAWNNYGAPDEIIWYERPLAKSFRQLRAGQGFRFGENNVRNYLAQHNLRAPVRYSDHHLSHAAGGFYTSGFTDACVVALDSIGEFDTFTIWMAADKKLKKVFAQKYPHSVGLWYSAITQRVGLKPQEDEYILMGMAAYGDPKRLYNDMRRDFIKKWPTVGDPSILFTENLHRGCRDWRPDLNTEQDLFDIAAAAQAIYEHILEYILQDASVRVKSKNLVLTGGCALNCSANAIAHRYFDQVWIMPNPGDAGSAVGSVLGHYRQHITWTGPYLGHKIKGKYPVESVVQELLANRICGVASGASEFGPRAFGNRSLLADPRSADIRDRVNDIKQRQRFRPFAPAILAEHAEQYFSGVVGPYMQYTAQCKRPDLYPAIVHADGTSRVQTVAKTDPGAAGFRQLLERWYALTGCPMLLNTSLNVKGKPIVNTRADADRFEKTYGVQVFS